MLGYEEDQFFIEEEKIELPKNARFILTAGWMFSPASNREESYFITEDESNYSLWLSWFDECEWDYNIQKLGKLELRKVKDEKEAIIALVTTFWENEFNDGLTCSPDYVTEFDIIDGKTIDNMIKGIWNGN